MVEYIRGFLIHKVEPSDFTDAKNARTRAFENSVFPEENSHVVRHQTTLPFFDTDNGHIVLIT